MLLDGIARVCHEANRGYQAAFPDPGVPVAASWDDIDEDMRESVRIGVAGVLDGNTPAESHQLWCETRAAQGWTYGPVKDEALKQHPCLVPYEELPAIQRRKDSLFAAIVRALS